MSQAGVVQSQILVAQLDVAGMESCGGAEIGTIDVDAEAGLVAFLQSDAGTSHAIARAVVDPESAGGSGNAREHRVELHRVERERQHMVRRRGETIIVVASPAKGHQERQCQASECMF